MKPADFRERERALDPQGSFIVQAPAGSGKTELLTRRFLSLLARVDSPEEILAITFTRKAAAEMRLRILETLSEALNRTISPESEFEREGYELAKAANKRNEECGWDLLSNPKRLRVQTIDSFCSSLVRQMPVLSQFGAIPDVTENARLLYEQAAGHMIDSILRNEQDPQLAKSMDTLLAFLDNGVFRLQQMIADMLEKRDQWLRHLPAEDDLDDTRVQFELVIRREVERELCHLVRLVPDRLQGASLKLFRYAQSNLRTKNGGVCNEYMLDLDRFPGSSLEEVPVWQGIADTLLTATGTLRKRLDKNAGFPAGNKADVEFYGIDGAEMKARKTAMKDLLECYEEHPEFIVQLARIRSLPAAFYSDEQWQLLEALTQILRSASAWLMLSFMENNAIDFAEIAERAKLSLGDETQPTDLALSMDYRIRHMLVDEFQDTSLSQFVLFQKLTAGWAPGDGHTFFAVGDPMQSIYRFREAQVSLFLNARSHGIHSGLPLQPLVLSVNFRSRRQIIDWVNDAFSKIFPREDKPHQGAVSYAFSEAARNQGEHAYVQSRLMTDADREMEAKEIAGICDETISQFPDQQIAILLRTKMQAPPIINALRHRGILFSAVETETLQERPVVRDILSLLRALLHPSDRIHWLAVLRAPWCGLMLEDLHTLLKDEPYAPVWHLLLDDTRLSALSTDGRERAERVRDILAPALADKARGEDANWLESVWRKLGGQACIETAVDLEAADVSFRIIREAAAAGNLLDHEKLESRLDKLFAPPSSDPDVRVQLMTIHKSKGLEFPTVILPGLERRGRAENKKLLNWVELADDESESGLLLAPVSKPGSQDPILQLMLDIEKSRARNELFRLLYVGATRARERLWLTACISGSNGKVSMPDNSLLACLKPALESKLTNLPNQQNVSEDTADSVEPQTSPVPVLKRLTSGWEAESDGSEPFHATPDAEEPEADHERLRFLWAGSRARHVGTVVHRQLQRISEDGLDMWNESRVADSRENYRRMLAALGVEMADLAEASSQVVRALQQSISDQRGRWLLNNSYESASSELALTAEHENKLIDVVIDRTFIDDQGTRWIVDYKTGAHSGSGLEAFLDEEVNRYKPQLERYAAIMRCLEDRPVRVGLYFPLHRAWREWEPAGSEGSFANM